MGTGKRGTGKKGTDKWAQEKRAQVKSWERKKNVFICKLLLLLFNQHLNYSMCVFVVVCCSTYIKNWFNCAKLNYYLIRTI